MKIKKPHGAADKLETRHVLEVFKLFPPNLPIAIGTGQPSGEVHSIAYHPDCEGHPAILLNQDWRIGSNLSTDPIEGIETQLQANLKGRPIVAIPNYGPVIEAVHYLAYYVEVHGCPPPYMAVFSDLRAAYAINEEKTGVNLGLFWLPDAIHGHQLKDEDALAWKIEFPWTV